MRRCLQDDGCTSSRSAGLLRLTKNIPRSPSFSVNAATRRRDSSPIRFIVGPVRDWPAASLVTTIFSFPSSPLSRRPCLSVEPSTVFRRSSILRKIGWSPPACFPYVQRLWRSLDTDRKGAAEVNRELLGWLSNRTQSERPFFAFLNYFDAHYPYQLEPGRLHRFGVEPTDDYQRILIQHWWDLDKTTLSPDGIAFAADAYDDCIADLDEQLGKLVDELDQRGILEKTWLIIASDHGESFGEHPGVFVHGGSLFDTELHVPLLIIPPGSNASKQTVHEPVSLRDLAATIVELTCPGSSSPFPGDSLTRFWKDAKPPLPLKQSSSDSALAEVVPNNPGKRDYWGLPEERPPLGALKDGEWSYIRREGDVHEELFHLREDAKEMRNLAGDPAAQTILQQFRAALDRLTGGPLLPQRFNH